MTSFFVFFISFHFQAELADALRKRKSRSDASDEDLGLPRSPSTPPRSNGGVHHHHHHHVVDGQMNSANAGRHHSSLGLLSMASSEIYDDSMESSSFLSTSKSSYEISSSSKHDTSDDIFPPEISLNSSRDSDTKLSHSAAKHKMAIRPKKKGPSRLPRKPTDVSTSAMISLFAQPICGIIFLFIDSTNSDIECITSDARSQ